MNMVASWLARCASHENCPSQAEAPLPTRLIEISPDGQECRLHTSALGEKGHYITLSHCWGPQGIDFLLKKANIEKLQDTIRTESLPRSFQDAIIITRRLKFQFLWIDAICIIQDSDDDWAHESACMAEIYRNGILMISAVAAPDSQHGILRPRNNMRSGYFGINKEFVFQTRDHVYTPTDPDGPLHSRGWCFQERMLSPRILHFGKQKLVWECVSRNWGEHKGFSGRPSDGFDAIRTRAYAMPFIWPSKLDLEKDSHQVKRPDAFYQCIVDFTKRKLTKRCDKLPAFSGLASAFQDPELGAYLAGLWEKDLVNGLRWRTLAPELDEQPPDSGEYIAPSWSWASTHGSCKFMDTQAPVSAGVVWKMQYRFFHSQLSPQLLSYHVELATSDTYGRIRSASITLRGYTRSVLVWLDRRVTHWPNAAFLDRARAWGPDTVDNGCAWMFGHPHERVPMTYFGKQNMPSASDKEMARRFVALPINVVSLGENSPSPVYSMLLLDPIEGLKDTYRRVGMVNMDDLLEISPARWEQKDLTLV